MAHPTKIPTRINILHHLPSHENEGFKKYGYIALKDNSETNYNAKEVRTINNVTIKALEIRLLLMRNHHSKNNFFNQVALSSLEF